MSKVLLFSFKPARMISSFLIAVSLLFSNSLTAQEDFDFTTCVGPPTSHPFPAVLVGVAMTQITIEGLGGGTTTMVLDGVSYDEGAGEIPHCPGPNCTSPQTLYGVTITNTGSTITVTGTPNKAGITIRFVVIATKDGQSCQRTYDLPINRKPVDLVIILDRSGSMDWGYDGKPGVGSPNRRWDGLITGIGVLKTNLKGLKGLKNTDMLGMRLFASGPNVIKPGAPYNADLIPGTEANINALSSVLDGVNPGGNTALGDGIIAGRDMVLAGAAGNTKTMIVFSDGVQNEGDKVKIPNDSKAYTHTLSDKKLSGNSNEIKIHTICLGSSGHNPELMSGIATANGGLYKNTVAGAEADFSTFFATNIEKILTGSSPQVVDIARGTFPASDGVIDPTAENSFFVDKGASALVITLIAPSSREPFFTSITKDGTNLIQFGTIDRGQGYISITFRLPISGLPGTKLNGEWKVRTGLGTAPKTPTPYTLMAMVDDHSVTPGYIVGTGNHRVNGVFNPKATLVRRGRAVSNATVQAIVVKPGDDLNDLLARANVSFDVPSGDPGSPDVAKLAVLMDDTAFLNKIKAKNQLLTLNYNASDSSYAGSFNGLDVTGPYQVIYKVRADDTALGTIQRYAQESFYVRFANIDLPNSNLSVSTNASGFSVITFTPVATNGKLIGLGWGPTITFESTGLKATNIVDKGNGSYEVTLDGKLSGPFTVTIGGEEVYSGSPDGLACYGPNANFWQKIKCWLMSLGLPAWTIWIILLIILLLLLIIIRRMRR